MQTETTKKMQVGIPRAMSYYNYFPFWYGFFNALDIEVVISAKTTKQTMSSGSALVVSETCLPVKVYVGHILDLLNKGVDKIFVPSIQSIDHKIYNCSKIRGLPDLIKNVVKKDFTIIDATSIKAFFAPSFTTKRAWILVAYAIQRFLFARFSSIMFLA